MTLPTSTPPVAPAITLGGVSPNQDATPWAFFEPLTHDFTIPADAYTATITVVNSARYAVGMALCIDGTAIVQVVGLPSVRAIQVKRIQGTVGTTFAAGKAITASGVPPPATADTSKMYDVLSSSFTVPAFGNVGTVQLTTGGWAEAGMSVYVRAAGWFVVTAVANEGKTLSVLNGALVQGIPDEDGVQDFNAPAATTVPSGAPVWAEMPGRGVRYDGEHFVVANANNVPGGAKLSLKSSLLAGFLAAGATGMQGLKFECGEIEVTGTMLQAMATTFATVKEVTFNAAFANAPTLLVGLPRIAAVGTNPEYLKYQTFAVNAVSASGFTLAGLYTTYKMPNSNTVKVPWIAIGA